MPELVHKTSWSTRAVSAYLSTEVLWATFQPCWNDAGHGRVQYKCKKFPEDARPQSKCWSGTAVPLSSENTNSDQNYLEPFKISLKPEVFGISFLLSVNIDHAPSFSSKTNNKKRAWLWRSSIHICTILYWTKLAISSSLIKILGSQDN